MNDNNNDINLEDQEEFMLTTKDNPYNPFTQWDDWYGFDVSKGYNTCSYLARIATSSHELSEPDHALALNAAIDEIIDLNILGIYIKVSRKFFEDQIKKLK